MIKGLEHQAKECELDSACWRSHWKLLCKEVALMCQPQAVWTMMTEATRTFKLLEYLGRKEQRLGLQCWQWKRAEKGKRLRSYYYSHGM